MLTLRAAEDVETVETEPLARLRPRPDRRVSGDRPNIVPAESAEIADRTVRVEALR